MGALCLASLKAYHKVCWDYARGATTEDISSFLPAQSVYSILVPRILPLLKNIPALSLLPIDALKNIAGAFELCWLPARTKLFYTHEAACHLHLVLSGSVILSTSTSTSTTPDDQQKQLQQQKKKIQHNDFEK